MHSQRLLLAANKRLCATNRVLDLPAIERTALGQPIDIDIDIGETYNRLWGRSWRKILGV
jgi:hypothetical protein